MQDDVKIYNEKFYRLNKAYWDKNIDELTRQYNAILDVNPIPSKEDRKILNQIDLQIKMWNLKVLELFEMYDRLNKKGIDNIPCPEPYFVTKEHKK